MMTPVAVESMLITFQLPIYPRQISQWRGAFAEMAGWENDLLHNHTAAEAYRYRYPLVQYRVRDGQAAVFALNDGISAVQKALFAGNWQCNWQGETRRLVMSQSPQVQQHLLQVGGAPQQYLLHKYLPFNQENYRLWQSLEGLVERVQLLETLLRNHLLAGIWGLGWNDDEEVVVRIQALRKTQLVSYHGQRLMAFDLVFSTNVDLPLGMGLGKAVSHGFGWMVPAAQPAGKRHAARQQAQMEGQ